jgi:hypothetical protein
MAIYMPEEKAFELAPAGSHLGICFRCIDLGTQIGQFGSRPLILFSWELTDELMSDGKRFVVSRSYGLSSSRKGLLREVVEGWCGRTLASSEFGKFDLSELLGTTALVGVRHELRDGQTYANVASIMRRPKAVADRMSPTNEAIGLSLADRPFRQFEYEKLPAWIRDKIARSPEYTAAVAPQPSVNAGVKRRLKAILSDEPAPKPEPAGEPLDDDETPFE